MAGKSSPKFKMAKSASIKRIPVAKMVISSLTKLNNRKGTSVQAIVKYISTNFDVNIRSQYLYIKKYLVNAVASGSIVQTKGTGAVGSFKLPPQKKTTKNTEPSEAIDETKDPTRKKKTVTEKSKNKNVTEKSKNKTVTEKSKNKNVTEKSKNKNVTEKTENKTVTEKKKTKKSSTPVTVKVKFKEKPEPTAKNTNKTVPAKKQAAKKNVAKTKK